MSIAPKKWKGTGVVLLTALFAVMHAHADLTSMTEEEMSEVDGAGVGVVLQDFVFAHGNDEPNGQIFKIGGIKSSYGEDVSIVVNNLYIARSGSNHGNNLQPVNIGRLTNPYSIDILDGDDIDIPGKAVLELAAPKQVDPSVGYDCLSTTATAGSGTCSSRPASSSYVNGERPDIGMAMGVQVGTKESHNININAKSAVVDGSYIRLWGDTDQNQLVAEIQLNFYTPELSINACDADGDNCGSTIYMRNFEMELALGNALQPMYLNVLGANDSSIGPIGNFVFEIKQIRQPAAGEIGSDGLRDSSDPAAWDFYNDYYTNPSYRSNIRIGELAVGDRNFGSSRIEGMLIQHLKITTHDLAN
ncbi:hypothetical protein QQM79_20790 [Marinobacteraceae bacterium S3BR75-40.1]